MPRTKVKRVRLTIEIPADLHALLHARALELDSSMVQVLKDVLRNYLNGSPTTRKSA